MVRILVTLFIVLIVDVPLTLSGNCRAPTVQAAETDVVTSNINIGFQWSPTKPGWTVEKVFSERPVTVPVEITAEGNVSRVKFTIPQEYKAFGISISNEVAEVKGGKADSTVIFDMPIGLPLGRHDLVIRIMDTETGEEIGSGTIPFILLPSEFECMC